MDRDFAPSLSVPQSVRRDPAYETGLLPEVSPMDQAGPGRSVAPKAPGLTGEVGGNGHDGLEEWMAMQERTGQARGGGVAGSFTAIRYIGAEVDSGQGGQGGQRSQFVSADIRLNTNNWQPDDQVTVEANSEIGRRCGPGLGPLQVAQRAFGGGGQLSSVQSGQVPPSETWSPTASTMASPSRCLLPSPARFRPGNRHRPGWLRGG